MPQSERQSLLPTHTNHSSSARVSTPRISFPASEAFNKSHGSSESVSSQETLKAGRAPLSDRVGLQEESAERPRSDEGRELSNGVDGSGERRDGLPKLSRECLWSEIKCYGSYMLPPFLIFGVLVVVISLVVVGWKMGWYNR